MFEQVFINSIEKFTSDRALVKRAWSDIEAQYNNAKRHYHNLSHLDHLANELQQVRDEISHWDLVVFAIAYHDIVYKTGRSDNEEKSADYAATILSGLLEPSQIEKCRAFILATKNHQNHPDPDINFFTDADLSILGASPEQYMAYTKQIRKEYQSYPDFLYKPGRKKVLQHFMGMERIYKTSYFFNQYEKQARENLMMELEVVNY